MIKCSVIIVSWNARDYLRGCLASLQETSTGIIWEAIVVDNKSSDGSPEMISKEFANVQLIRSDQNRGFAWANNMGMKRAKGEYFALINSDVVVHRECLQSLIQYLELHQDVGLVGPKIMDGDGLIQPTSRRLPTVWNYFCRSLALDKAAKRLARLAVKRGTCFVEEEAEALSGCFWMARRKAVEQVGGLDERFFFYGEDLDWCKRFRNAGWKVMMVPKATATHFGGRSSANAPLKYSIELHRANLAYWQKHHGKSGMAIYYVLSVSHHIIRLILRSAALILRRKNAEEIAYKIKRSWVCLRWLLLGKGV